MAKITYVEFGGAQHVVEVASGLSVMQGAKMNGIPGIDADCGGGCSCATCHVYVDPAWTARVGARNPIEDATIEFADNVAPNSRLACQIQVSDALDGLLVRMPATQR